MAPLVEQVSEAKKSVSERIGTFGAYAVVIAMAAFLAWVVAYFYGYVTLPYSAS